jgi:hypothetical protein
MAQPLPLPDDIARALAVSDRHAYVEQRIFVLSPFGIAPTALLIFAILAGTFAIAWEISGRPFLTSTDDQIYLGTMIKLGLWFSLMVTTVLAMQRYARFKDREELARYAAVLRGGWQSATIQAELTPGRTKLMPANIIGLLLGTGASYLLYAARGDENLLAYPALLIWFCVVTTGLIMTFTRGVALTRGGTANMRRTIANELVIDLLRVDKLSVVGRSAARPSLIWFTVSAVMLLLFIGGGITLFTGILLIACAAMGLWVFIATMEQVHRKIQAEKTAELERVRGEIDTVRARAASDADCATKLQGLLAYEKRIDDAQEWPFDQNTAVRVGASALILTVPWFGQAIAAYMIEHMGHVG